jgi:hypothetical protein
MEAALCLYRHGGSYAVPVFTLALLPADQVLSRGHRILVTVHGSYGAQIREDGASLRNAAAPAATRTSDRNDPCYQHVATTVRSHSTNRLSSAQSDPNLPFRHGIAGGSWGASDTVESILPRLNA